MSCHVIIGYIIGGIGLIVFHVTEAAIEDLYSYLIIYQIFILCLPDYNCVQGHSFIYTDLGQSVVL